MRFNRPQALTISATVPLFVTDKYFDPDELTYKRVLANISANKAIEMGSTPAWGYNYYGYLTIS